MKTILIILQISIAFFFHSCIAQRSGGEERITDRKRELPIVYQLNHASNHTANKEIYHLFFM